MDCCEILFTPFIYQCCLSLSLGLSFTHALLLFLLAAASSFNEQLHVLYNVSKNGATKFIVWSGFMFIISYFSFFFLSKHVFIETFCVRVQCGPQYFVRCQSP